MKLKLSARSIILSYLIGGPIGLLTVLMIFLIPAGLTGEGFVTMFLVSIYGKAIIGLLISFSIVLGYAGNETFKDLANRKSLLNASFKYALRTNFTIWIVFTAITIAEYLEDGISLLIVFPVIAFVICVAVTTFTAGMLICYLIKHKIMLERAVVVQSDGHT